MKLVKYISIVIFLFTLTFAFKPTSSFACSCIPSPPVQEELERVSAVFSGKVLEIKEDSSSNTEPLKVTFQVNRTWKGVNETELSIYTGRDSAGCGYSFKVNESYLVYAIESEGKLITGLCSLTKELSSAEEDLSIIGEGNEPTNTTSKDGKNDYTTDATTWIILFAVCVIGLVLVFFQSRKNSS
jgi:hypothetical protein